MKRAICKVGPGGSVNVQSASWGRVFGPGAEADLDEVVRSADGDRPAETLADALGRYLPLFEVVEPPTVARRRGGNDA